jgi:hypothetical protein
MHKYQFTDCENRLDRAVTVDPFNSWFVAGGRFYASLPGNHSPGRKLGSKL